MFKTSSKHVTLPTVSIQDNTTALMANSGAIAIADEDDGPPNHISTLKPSIFGSEHFNRPHPYVPFGADNIPKLAGLMRLAPKEDARQAYRRRRHIWPVVAICVETGIPCTPVKA